MTIAELTQKITDSVLSDEAKQKIFTAMQSFTEVTEELEEQVKELIQEDIDRDLAALEEGDEDPELLAAHTSYAAEIDAIESELQDGLADVERELGELDQMRAEISSAEDAYKIAQLRNELTAGS